MNYVLRRKVFVVSIAAVVSVLLVIGFLPRAREVEVVQVSRGPLQVTLEEEGRTRLKDRFTVSAPASGYLRRIRLKVGDEVGKGQLVAILEPTRSQALDPRNRASAESGVAAAEAVLRAAMERKNVAAVQRGYLEQRRERLKALYDRGTISKDEFDQIESEFQKALAVERSVASEVDLARAELQKAKVALRNFASVRESGMIWEIVSPLKGTIVKVYRESEGAVNAGEPLVEIGNVEDLEVRVDVLSSDAVKIRRGTRVLFKRWGKDDPLAGRVRLIEPAGFTKVSSLGVEEQRVLVIADITSPREQWQRLGDGFRLEAHFVLWEGDRVLQVPASALFRWGERLAVFVADEGRARRRLVEIGHRNAMSAEILSGLREGEKVLVYPDDSIGEGTRIKVRLMETKKEG